MFKATLKSDILKNIVNAISPVSDEVKFSITPEGMAMRAVDPTHIEMIGLDINKAAFDSFEADETEVGLELDKVRDVLKLASSGDVVSIEQDSERGKLIFKLGNITRRMNLLDTSSINAPKVPNLDLSATIVVRKYSRESRPPSTSRTTSHSLPRGRPSNSHRPATPTR